MLSLEESIPQKSDSFLSGIDIFYTQFNDVSFYIEDEDQENFYFEIFKKIFPKIKLSKIFPLRGKDNVIKKCQEYIGDKKRIFLVDKDFDDLLYKKQILPNLFYLERYSIENYLIDLTSFKEYIIEEKPKIKRTTINECFRLKEAIQDACDTFYDLIVLYILIQEKKLNIKNTSLPAGKFCRFGVINTLKVDEINTYKAEIQEALSLTDKRLKIECQIKKLKKRLNFKKPLDILHHIPGKYLITYFKSKIEHIFNIASRSIDSFIFRLAKTNSFKNLSFLKERVNNYINETVLHQI